MSPTFQSIFLFGMTTSIYSNILIFIYTIQYLFPKDVSSIHKNIYENNLFGLSNIKFVNHLWGAVHTSSVDLISSKEILISMNAWKEQIQFVSSRYFVINLSINNFSLDLKIKFHKMNFWSKYDTKIFENIFWEQNGK